MNEVIASLLSPSEDADVKGSLPARQSSYIKPQENARSLRALNFLAEEPGKDRCVGILNELSQQIQKGQKCHSCLFHGRVGGKTRVSLTRFWLLVSLL